MSAPYEKRKENLQKLINNPHEAFLLTDEVNIGYFCGFFHSEGYLLITQEAAVLLVDFRYIEAARQKAVGCEVICYKKLSEDLSSQLKKHGVSALHVEASHMTVQALNTLSDKLKENGTELISDGKLDSRITSLRIIKDDTELEKISKAQQIAEKAYLEMLNYLKPGVRERERSARLEYLMKMNGAEDISFDLITVTGKKTSLPHGVPADDVVCAGDFFTCDFGAVYEGYHSDTTRTVAVKSATDEMKQVYDVVLRAQLAALKTIKAGVEAHEVDKTARDIIANAGYGDYFGHSTGHGVGLNIHEAPYASPRGKEVLRSGMVLTDEPGIYLPNKFGVRIEDMVCVTENGCRNFVNLPKGLIIV